MIVNSIISTNEVTPGPMLTRVGYGNVTTTVSAGVTSATFSIGGSIDWSKPWRICGNGSLRNVAGTSSSPVCFSFDVSSGIYNLTPTGSIWGVYSTGSTTASLQSASATIQSYNGSTITLSCGTIGGSKFLSGRWYVTAYSAQ